MLLGSSMLSKFVFIVCLGLYTSNYAVITTYEEALNALGQHIVTAYNQKQQERYKALELIQERLLVCGIQQDKISDFFSAVERGNIPAMRACLRRECRVKQEVELDQAAVKRYFWN